MNELKLKTIDSLRDFMTWAKDAYTTKISHTEGGCNTCGYGGYNITDGFETNFDELFENLEKDIDNFVKHTYGNE